MRPKCDCGAKHTSFPKFHYHWCQISILKEMCKAIDEDFNEEDFEEEDEKEKDDARARYLRYYRGRQRN